ncbi:cadherin-like beta sandwich domain-containing protein, partial [Brevibacillus sp. NPDC003359]|uniref:cadherin-like beta sandwich domain-containing protein n=1 Tax=Brevibacillus sp. NPDC003359 TaxID=3363950 RepID=UPI003690CF86
MKKLLSKVLLTTVMTSVMLSNQYVQTPKVAATSQFNPNLGLNQSLVDVFGGGYSSTSYDTGAWLPTRNNWNMHSPVSAKRPLDGSVGLSFANGNYNQEVPAIAIDSNGTMYVSMIFTDQVTQGIRALSKSGEVLWERPGNVAKSILIGQDGNLYVSYYDSIVSLKKSDGTINWSKSTGPNNYYTDTIELGPNGNLFGITSPRDAWKPSVVFSINSHDGAPIWERALTQSDRLDTSRYRNELTIAADGTIYASYAYSNDHIDYLPTKTYMAGFSPDGTVKFMNKQVGIAQHTATGLKTDAHASRFVIGPDKNLYTRVTTQRAQNASDSSPEVVTNTLNIYSPSGDLIKEVLLFSGIDNRNGYPDVSATPPIITEDGNVYVTAHSSVDTTKYSQIIKVKPDYTMESLQIDPLPHAGSGDKQMIVDKPNNLLLVPTVNGITSINLKTFKVEWKYTAENNYYDQLYISSTGNIIGINARQSSNPALHVLGKEYLPPNQNTMADHLMTLLADTGSSAVIKYNNTYPSDITDYGHQAGNMLRWQISTNGINFTSVAPSKAAQDNQAVLSNLDPTKGYYVRNLYKNNDGRIMVYQRMILRPDKYTGVPLPSESDFVPTTLPTSILVSASQIKEAQQNDGSIMEKQIVTLTNGTFAADMSTGVMVNNLPAGLGISVTRDSDKQITISFTGKATAHANANDVTNATVTIDKAKITGATANVTSNAFTIDFQDGSSSVTNFRQTAVTQTTATLAWDAVTGADNYIIKTDTGVTVYSGAALTTVVSGLKPSKAHSFTIIAKGKDGESTPTALTVTTPAIVDPVVDQVNTTKNSVSFDIQEVEGAKKYVVNRNPEWTYEAAGGNRYEVTWKNTATGEGPTPQATVYSSNGKIPHTETGLSANTPYNYTVTAFDESGNASAPQQVKATTAPLSTLADLKSLSLSQGTLTPAFAANTVSYTTTVTNATASVNVSAAAADHMAKVTINGNEAKSA